MLNRILELDLPKGQSLFLWGARKTGKTTFLKTKYPKSPWFDLLNNEVFLDYNSNPHWFREHVLEILSKNVADPIVVDEIQKVPALLDEIHWLIENGPRGSSFILCGSSLRRIKQEGYNLLGGRAWGQSFLPLCYPEIPKFDLLKLINHGLIPSHYLQGKFPIRSLKSYLADYLIPEVQYEGRIRQLGSFGRFLESISYSNGELLNYSNIAREAMVTLKVVQSYVDLLVDMLIGYLVFPFHSRGGRKDVLSTPKFYLFDPGIVGVLRRQPPFESPKGPEFGHRFEHYIFLELHAFISLKRHSSQIQFWRTKTGTEVDFILNRGAVALEVKLTSGVDKKDLKGLLAFAQDNIHAQRLILVCLESKRRVMQCEGKSIEILPVEDFLSDLWSFKILQKED